MSKSINTVVISGNLTRDPEARQTRSGSVVVTLGVAVNEREKDPATGQWGDRASFIDVTVFGKQAESCVAYLAKGSQVLIDGKLRQDRWQDQQTGQNRSAIKLIADDVVFAGTAQAVGGPAQQQMYPQQAQYPQGQPAAQYPPQMQPAQQAVPAQQMQPQVAPAPQMQMGQAQAPQSAQASGIDDEIPF